MQFRQHVLLPLLALSLAGCVSTGTFPSVNLTNVGLNQGNYQLVATGVTGTATAAYLFGFSASMGMEMSTVALFRLEGEGGLYEQALANFWANFEATHGSAVGRSLALVNVRYDGDAQNILGIYTRPTVTVRADVVEFE